ncbi:unnamed protein product [Prunus armeniaca]|uniref:beta-aspartyl-peptidase n=1 Tax=Prunus armeniaca TaxID=36596 RepID=A0A6J5XG67_PRUAR|nr:unnamed protein product [Prunus armeniaca]CAB4311483.1 unnamed protein product [Prunus armeniaca]
MEKTPHIYLAFDGAEAFAREQGVETVDSSHFITPENVERLKQAKVANRVQIDYTQPLHKDEKKETPEADGDSKLGTVGCLAVDSLGNLASATSTGGLVNKMVGRIGDTPIIGAGTYANSLCAVSATGKGEAIIRYGCKGCSSCYGVQKMCLSQRSCSLCCGGGHSKRQCMFRACATEDGYSEIGIWPSVQN